MTTYKRLGFEWIGSREDLTHPHYQCAACGTPVGGKPAPPGE